MRGTRGLCPGWRRCGAAGPAPRHAPRLLHHPGRCYHEKLVFIVSVLSVLCYTLPPAAIDSSLE